MTRTWDIAKVVDNADPDKRRRLKLRLPHMSSDDIDDDHLLWTQPLQTGDMSFDLPQKDEAVLVLSVFDSIGNATCVWTYLPDKESYKDLSDDAYPDAFIRKHREVLHLQYDSDDKWWLKVKEDINIETDKLTAKITGDKVEIEFDKVKIETDGSSATVKVDQVEFSSDGSKATLKNAGVNLADLIKDLHTALQTHQHGSSLGPTTPPLNAPDFVTSGQKFGQLLK